LGENPFFSPVVSKTHIFARVGQKDNFFVATLLQNCCIFWCPYCICIRFFSAVATIAKNAPFELSIRGFLKFAYNLMNARQTLHTLFNNKQQKSFGNRHPTKKYSYILRGH
jgi:hypothetical protein